MRLNSGIGKYFQYNAHLSDFRELQIVFERPTLFALDFNHCMHRCLIPIIGPGYDFNAMKITISSLKLNTTSSPNPSLQAPHI